MARFYVWTKGQVLAALAGALLLTALGAVGLTLLFLDGQPSAPQEGEAQMVFAEAELLYTVETPPPVVDTSLRVEVVRSTQQPPMAGKQVLIYHTHTWEAFEQVENARYVETEKWRSKDNAANMVAVGDALTAALEALGCTGVHDETAFEPPDLSTAYQRSLEMLEARLAAGESYDLYIDLHRDAVASNSTIKRTVNVAGEELARFMVLVGKGQSYAEKPDWQANYAVAEKITASLNHQVEGLCRDVKVKTGRFNQHIAPRCVLIECGLNYNTLEQVLNGVPYLAQAICDSLAE
ncbi:MAG: stage II sporulation protein P [Clostridia bacterium]|nr:stage II sporulation protein P [Clostridia bacterium]